jgi:hypothetical protein
MDYFRIYENKITLLADADGPWYFVDRWRSCSGKDVSSGTYSFLMSYFTFFSDYDSHSMIIDLYLQTGKNWHEGRSTNSDDWNCHAVHSIGCICHMQNYSISLHSKLLMPIMLLLKCQSKIILLHPTITMKFSGPWCPDSARRKIGCGLCAEESRGKSLFPRPLL